jgi:hypothetical protein
VINRMERGETGIHSFVIILLGMSSTIVTGSGREWRGAISSADAKTSESKETDDCKGNCSLQRGIDNPCSAAHGYTAEKTARCYSTTGERERESCIIVLGNNVTESSFQKKNNVRYMCVLLLLWAWYG